MMEIVVEPGPLHVTLLGSVRAWRGAQSVAVGPPQRQAVLAALLLAGGRPVSTSRLIEDVWGDEATDKADAALRAHVSVLRRVLEPRRPARSASRVILSVPSGYRIPTGVLRLDADAFREHVNGAEALRSAGRDRDAAVRLSAALELWEGEQSLVGVPGPGAESARRRLGEEGLVAWEELLDLEIAARPPDRPVHPDLLRALARHPHRERLYTLLVRSYWGQGRRAEAIEAYAQARDRLRNDLGVDPGPALQELHRRVLAGEELEPAPSEDDAGPAGDAARPLLGDGAMMADVVWAPEPPVADHDQPVPTAFARNHTGPLPAPAPLVGRDDVVAAAVDAIRAARDGVGRSSVLLRGHPGVGTSALGLAAARAVRSDFPGGVVVLGQEADGAAWGAALAGLGAQGACLLLVDGVRRAEDGLRGQATREAQAAEREDPVVLLMTGSHRLPRIAGRRVEVGLLGEDAATELFAAELGDDRVSADPIAAWAAVQLVGELPRVLVATTSALSSRPSWALRPWLDDFMTWTGSLEALMRHSMELFFGEHYAALDEGAARVFRLIGAYPWPTTMTPEVLAAALAEDVDEVRFACDQLYDRGLLESPSPRHFEISLTLRRYAETLWLDDEPGAVRAETLDRLLAVFRERAESSTAQRDADRPASLRLIARHAGHPEAARLAALVLPPE